MSPVFQRCSLFWNEHLMQKVLLNLHPLSFSWLHIKGHFSNHIKWIHNKFNYQTPTIITSKRKEAWEMKNFKEVIISGYLTLRVRNAHFPKSTSKINLLELFYSAAANWREFDHKAQFRNIFRTYASRNQSLKYNTYKTLTSSTQHGDK